MKPLTPRQSAAVRAAQERWRKWINSTEPADRFLAEEAVRYTYRMAGVSEPENFLWFEDLRECFLALEQLSSFRECTWMLPEDAQPIREEIRERLRQRMGLDSWAQVLDTLGPEHTPNRYEERRHLGIPISVAVPNHGSLHAGLPTAIGNPVTACGEIESAAAAVQKEAFAYYSQLRNLASQSAGPGISGHPGISVPYAVYYHYRFDFLFRHECLLSVLGEQASAPYEGLCRALQYVGPWWAFTNAAILCERPVCVQHDGEGRLHNEHGPALVFRNGVEFWAWHGTWTTPSALSKPLALKKPRAAPRRRLRHPLEIELPDDHEARLAALRVYGPLRFLDRYLGGEYETVWEELVASGARVREQPLAADAWAVALETMERVRRNLLGLINHLTAAGHEFTPPPRDKVMPFQLGRLNLLLDRKPKRWTPYRPPESGLRHRLRRLEKDAGDLPLSLRAWYHAVGSIALDRLNVLPFSDVLRQWDNSAFEVGIDGLPFVATISSYADGRAHAITLPSSGMDAQLEGTPDNGSFVEHLRRSIPHSSVGIQPFVRF
jgi:hypothetical protein